jgi:hypothetical protein
MGTSGRGSLELGDSSGDIFWMSKSDFVPLYWKTFPELMPLPAGSSPPLTNVGTSSSAGSAAPETETRMKCHVEFPNLSISAAPVFSFYKVLSDELVTMGRNSGMYNATFACIVPTASGGTCGALRTIPHVQFQCVASSNLVKHISQAAKSDDKHVCALQTHQASSKNFTEENGAFIKKYNFQEAFPHLVRQMWTYVRGLSLTKALAPIPCLRQGHP